MHSSLAQQTLWGDQDPTLDASLRRARRVDLGAGAWIDRCPEWVTGHARLFETLRESLPWRQSQRVMYERTVAVPRLLATAERGARPPIVERMIATLTERYGEPLDQVTFALYRDGRDSVAMHQDKVLKDLPRALVAIVSLGGPRRFLVKPLAGGPSRPFGVGLGDLLVMGGTCQRTFEHGVPKTRHAPPRMAIMFRSHRLYAAATARGDR